jgi:hypothetical protein
MEFKHYILLSLLFPWVGLVCCQSISGVITDKSTRQAIEYANVYIQGSTSGAVSNKDGYFEFESDITYGQLIVSHVSYETSAVELGNSQKSELRIALDPRIYDFTAVSIQSKDQRESNLKHFRKELLGSDYWGKHATIENDSVLVFRVEYYADTIANRDLIGSIKKFEAMATSPLTISLPKLGYTLQYDLVRYIETGDPVLGKVTSSSGYFYFTPVKKASARKQRNINKNRTRAYYYSPQHFIRSLYSNRLKENGYLLLNAERGAKTNQIIYNYFYPDSCKCIVYRDEEAIISGMKYQNLTIRYYGYDNSPVNLNKHGNHPYVKLSQVIFLEEECIIRKDGSISGSSIVFGPGLNRKRIGASLPYDYEPPISF